VAPGTVQKARRHKNFYQKLTTVFCDYKSKFDKICYNSSLSQQTFSYEQPILIPVKFRHRFVGQSVCLRVTIVYFGKTADWIEKCRL